MKHICIITGEDTDIPKERFKDTPIDIFSFPVSWKESSLSAFYKRMRDTHDSPQTSQPSVKTLQELFATHLKTYQDLLVITISSKFSGTYNTAQQAKKLFNETQQKRIHILDSQTVSGCEALLIFKALALIKQNKEIAPIIEELQAYIPLLHFIGVFDDPHWLQKGGRLNAVQAMLVKQMIKTGFRPVLTIKDGQIVTKRIHTHAKEKTQALFAQFQEEVKEINRPITAIITHSDCLEEAERLKQLLEDFSPEITVKYISTLSPVTGGHLGPDSILLAWATQ